MRSVREAQKDSLLGMLGLGEEEEGEGAGEEGWKVVVFDKAGGDILALTLRVGDLRRRGVTLTLRIDDDARQPIPDAPAVYFVTPTRSNAALVARDSSRGLYSAAYVHFTSAVPRPVLEALAQEALAAGCTAQIRRVYDQHAAFLALEHDLFVSATTATADRSTFSLINDPTVSDADARAMVERAAETLLSVVVTLGVVPIIRAPRNTAAALVAERIHDLLQQSAAATITATATAATTATATTTTSTTLHRPLLVVLDRSSDLGVMLAHPWTYRALVSELLEFDLNRATIPAKTSASGAASSSATATAGAVQRFDLDSSADRFWAKHAGSPFPTVAVELDNEVKAYKAAVEEVGRFSRGLGTGGSTAEDALLSAGDAELTERGLSRFIGKMPELRETKRIIDAHASVAPALLERIKEREIDAFFSAEEPLLTRAGGPTSADTKEVVALVSNPKAGTPEDRLRLALVWFLACKGPAPADTLAALEQALAGTGIDMRPFAFAKRAKAFADSLAATSTATTSTSAVSPAPTASPAPQGQSAIASMFERMYSGVRGLLPRSADYSTTRIIEALMELRGQQFGIEDSFIYLDPKLAAKQTGPGAAPVPRKTTPFRDAIVFMVGGGNYIEHQNLVDWARRTSSSTLAATGPVASAQSLPQQQQIPGRRVIYGATEMLHPHKFLELCAQLAS